MGAASGFVHRHRVRYHETDAQHHLFNSRYLEIVDVALTEFFRSLGWPYRELVDAGCDPSLVHVEIDFRRPAPFDTELQVEVGVTRVGTSSFTLAFEFGLDGRPVATVAVVYVNFDVATQRSRPLPAAVHTALREALGGPDGPLRAPLFPF